MQTASGAPADGSDLKVFISRRDTVCGDCRETLGRNAWITLAGERGALCLACGDLDHLVFLPSGDRALTMRARKYSSLTAVVLRWSRTRERYERQGLLVQEEALARAEAECLSDAGARERRRQREAERRQEVDHAYLEEFARRIGQLFPGCPGGRARVIAEHACAKYSDRIGRSAAARQFDEAAIRLAVRAHVRHRDTNYDELLSRGVERPDARARVEGAVASVLARWSEPARE